MLVALAYFLAYRLRFEFHVTGQYEELFENTVWWVVPVSLAALAAFGVYQRVWTFVGQREYEGVVKGVVVSTLVIVGAIALLHPVQTPPVLRVKHNVFSLQSSAVTLPASVIALFLLLAMALLVGARFIVHLVIEGRTRSFRASKGARDVLIVGAGDGGRLVVRELARNPQLGLRPVGFVDDDPRKQGFKDEYGLRALGTTGSEDLARILDDVEPDEVVIAIPSAPGTLRARVVAACRARGIPVRTTPTVFELLRDGSGRVEVTRQLREVQVEDILGREPVRVEIERVGAYLAEEVVLVTGAGGSIGSELCRQIARVGPRRMVLLDHAEDNLFEILRELEEDRHVRTAVPVLADCKERERMREVLAEHRPAVVFHAAAYKHVTMMELNPVEAIRNNALATQLMARLAGEPGVGTFVLVSTDKAVKPATVMGARRRSPSGRSRRPRHPTRQTRYATVRFGNVLGSSGSVVPIFRRQIAAGGPVTVTDPRMKRLLHDDPGGCPADHPRRLAERAQRRRSGQVFVLEMGDPIRIARARGDDDQALGARARARHRDRDRRQRPGEKLHEDLFNPHERPQPTPAQKIVRARAGRARSRVGGAHVRRDQPAGAGRRSGRARQAGRRARAKAPAPQAISTPGPPRRLPGRWGRLPSRCPCHHFISSVGADAGFASIIGLAILVLLYFAHARDTANLHDEAEELAHRLLQAETRIAQLSRQQPAAPAPAPAFAPPPTVGQSDSSIRAARAGAALAVPVAPMGVGAPALAAATRVVPAATPPSPAEVLAPAQPSSPVQAPGSEDEAPVAAPVEPVFAEDAEPAEEERELAAAHGGRAMAASAPVRERSVGPVAPATAAGAANGGGREGSVAAPVAAARSDTPPRPPVQIRSGTPSGGRRPSLPPRTPAPRRGGAGRRFGLLIGGLLAVAAIAVLVIVTQSGGSSPSHAKASLTTNAPTSPQRKARATFSPASVTVAVLNGTATNDLAHSVSAKLTAQGYKQGTLATASSQAQTATVVAFRSGFRNDALQVATALKLGPASVQPIDPSTQAVACPPPSACTANVVVTVGQDLATL